ncbi:MAG TPA: tetratricopeptide repeat protein [Burkholderiales bacterium]
MSRIRSLLAEGRHREAADLAEAALAGTPADIDLLFAAAQAQFFLGQEQRAVECFRRILELNPALAGVHCNLAAIHFKRGEFPECRSHAEAALAIVPGMPEALYHLGRSLLAADDPRGAIARLEAAVKQRPQFAEGVLALGEAYEAAGASANALDCYERALVLRPDWVPALVQVARIADLENRLDAARELLERALAREPAHAGARRLLAGVLRQRGDFPRAAALLEDVLRQRPAAPELMVELLDLRAELCDWRDPGLAARIADAAADDLGFDVNPFVCLSLALPEPVHAVAFRNFAGRVRRRAPTIPPVDAPRAAGGKLRVGYLSPDLREHAVGTLVAGMFAAHDRRRFDVHVYSLFRRQDPVQEAIRRGAAHFGDLGGWTPEKIARRIRADRIDVLVDLAGFTLHSVPEAVAARPAPLVIQYLGYPHFAAPDWADYVVVDPVLLPPEERRLLRAPLVLPECFVGSDPLPFPEPPERTALGLPGDAVVLCCFGVGRKLNPGVFDAWAEILRRSPAAILWLYAPHAAQRENLGREARARGLDPARLVFAAQLPLAQHIARYGAADLALDTFPYSGGATTLHALWAELPVVTLRGCNFAGRMSASIVTAAGVPELVAQTPEAYVELAARLAGDVAARGALRQRLRQGRGHATALSTARFLRGFEAGLSAAWERHLRGEPPGPLEVPADGAS